MFFNKNYDLGLKWYADFFDHAGPQTRAIGEITPTYAMSEVALERIVAAAEIERIIIMLRDPWHRFRSQYSLIRQRNPAPASLDDLIADHPHILRSSLYSEMVPLVRERLAGKRIEIFVLEQLVADPKAARARIAAFLDVDPDGFASEAGLKPSNAGFQARNEWMARSAYRLAKTARGMGNDWLVNGLKRLGTKHVLGAERPGNGVSIEDELGEATLGPVRERLVAERRSTEQMLGIAIPEWQR